jgi:hypothetical protein
MIRVDYVLWGLALVVATVVGAAVADKLAYGHWPWDKRK